MILLVDRNDVDERLHPHVDCPDIRLFLPCGGALALTGSGKPLGYDEAVAAGYDPQHAGDSAKPLGGVLGRHGWSASSSGWTSAGFLEWWVRMGWRDEPTEAVADSPPHITARAAARTTVSLASDLSRLVRFVRQSCEAARQACQLHAAAPSAGRAAHVESAIEAVGASAGSVSHLMVALGAEEAEVAAGFIEAREADPEGS